jgi:hypothetical protein
MIGSLAKKLTAMLFQMSNEINPLHSRDLPASNSKLADSSGYSLSDNLVAARQLLSKSAVSLNHQLDRLL